MNPWLVVLAGAWKFFRGSPLQDKKVLRTESPLQDFIPNEALRRVLTRRASSFRTSLPRRQNE